MIITADDPRIIDWIGAKRAPAALDLATCLIILTELTPEFVDDPQRPHAYDAAARAE